jgi:hypothetical protein
MFLELILLELKHARIAESTRGAQGGYQLKRPPMKIFRQRTGSNSYSRRLRSRGSNSLVYARHRRSGHIRNCVVNLHRCARGCHLLGARDGDCKRERSIQFHRLRLYGSAHSQRSGNV